MVSTSRRYSAKKAAEMNESDVSDIKSSEESFNIESDEDESVTGSSIKFVKLVEEIILPTTSSVQDNQGSSGLNDDDSNGDYDDEVIPRKKQRTSVATRNSTKNATPADKWHDIDEEAHNDQSPHDFEFIPTRQPGVADHINETFEPIDCFTELFSDEILQKLSKIINSFAKIKCQLNTNARKHSVYTKWKPLTKAEILCYIAIMIVMGLQPRPEIRDYWSTKDIYHTPWFSKVMTRDEFEAIHHTMVHLSDNDKKKANDKIEPFMNELIHQFQATFYPFQDVSIDEVVTKYKSKWKSKQYNPNKPSKYYIKTYIVCDSTTGYAFNILTYFGSDTSYNPAMSDFGNSEKIFEYLLSPLGSGHYVFADRFYITY